MDAGWMTPFIILAELCLPHSLSITAGFRMDHHPMNIGW